MHVQDNIKRRRCHDDNLARSWVQGLGFGIWGLPLTLNPKKYKTKLCLKPRGTDLVSTLHKEPRLLKGSGDLVSRAIIEIISAPSRANLKENY